STAFCRSLSAGEIFFGYASGPPACHPRRLFQDTQPHISIWRAAHSWLSAGLAKASPLSRLRDPDTHADHSRAQRGKGPGREIWRRLPAIQTEHLVLIVDSANAESSSPRRL